MICILRGHSPVTQEGAGKYAGRRATFCRHCGQIMTLEAKDQEGYRPARADEIERAWHEPV